MQGRPAWHHWALLLLVFAAGTLARESPLLSLAGSAIILAHLFPILRHSDNQQKQAVEISEGLACSLMDGIQAIESIYSP